jgi:hypothetical protein
MPRTVIRILFAAALLAAGIVPASAAPGTTSLVCEVDQTRIFTPPLGSLPGDAHYTFTSTGTVTCAGVSSGAPAALTGTISVGNRFTTPSANPTCDALPRATRCADPAVSYGADGLLGCDGFLDPCVETSGGDGMFGCGRTEWWWQESAGELFGAAERNETSETRFIRWGSAGDVTVLKLDNDDIVWLKVEGTQSGTAIASAAVSAIGPADGDGPCDRQPPSQTIATTRDVGAEVRGALWAVSSPDEDVSCGDGCSTFRLVGTDVLQS